MRRLIVLSLLYGGMLLIEPLGTPDSVPRALLAFGFLILAAYTVGEIARSVGLPKIVGYLLAGMVFGPYGFEVFDLAAAEQLDGISDLAIALIAFVAGAELRWKEVAERGTGLAKVMTAELIAVFVLVTAALYAVSGWVPFLSDLDAASRLVFALIFGSIAIVHSPAVTLGIIAETGGRSSFARSTLGIVLLSDVAVVVFFSLILAVAQGIVPPTGSEGLSIGMVAWKLGGAMVIGPILGFAVAAYLRFVRRELIFFAILVSILGLELAQLAQVELLLTMLLCGFVAENTSRPELGEELREAMHRAAAPVFVVFFCLSGAKVDGAAVLPMLPVVLPLVLLRVAALWGGVRVGAAWARMERGEGDPLWTGLVSQAGVAIGLAAIAADVYGELGTRIATMTLAFIAVNEIIGPVIFRSALKDRERPAFRPEVFKSPPAGAAEAV